MNIDLWDMVNANAFEKVNAFGDDLQFWFVRKPGVDYSSRVGQVRYWGDDRVILVVEAT